MVESIPTKFRAIIVGAGPVGLYLAHTLSKANIDYVVLEQFDSVIRYEGAGVLLYPQTLRLLDQIGLYEKAENDFIISHHLTDLLTSNGRVIKSTPLWSVVGERHAYPMVGTSRAQLIALLYENLPERETRVRSSAAVRDVETHEKGVKVYLHDGSVEEGSILIGADGVHSRTRQIMQQKLARTPPGTWPMTANYNGLYGCFQSCHGFEPGTFYQSRGSGIVSQLMVGADKGYFGILRPISSTTEPKRYYTTEDRDHLAQELADIMVAPGVRFQKMWELTAKDPAAMVNQEEGYCDRWYHERVVLAGDAVHKSTSATGLGVNTGLNSAAVLANELHRALRCEPDPGTRAIEDAFARYQRIRGPEASRLHAIGRSQVRRVTWETWSDWLFDRFVNPWVSVHTVAGIIGRLIKGGQILDYVPFHDREVQEPWDHSPTV